MSNDNLVLIGGKSSTGKSMSLMNLKDPEGVLYLNCENNKKLPFRSKFDEKPVTDPYQVYSAFEYVDANPERYHTVIVDTLTYLMDMFESVHVIGAANTMQQWGAYQQYMKNLMAQYVATAGVNVIFLAHTMDVLNEAEMINETLVKVKGSLMNQGIESFFSTVLSAKKVPLSKLKPFLDPKKNQILNVSPREAALEYKYVFQTMLTKETVNERMRSPLGMFSDDEVYMDNDVQLVIDRLHQYYA